MQMDPYDKEPYTPEAAYAADPDPAPVDRPAASPPASAPVPDPAPAATASFVEPMPAPPVAAAPAPAATPSRLGGEGGAWWTDRATLRHWAILGGLLGGVLILLGAFVLSLLVTVIHLVGGADPDLWFFDDDAFPGVALAVVLWGLASGGLVLLGALRLKEGAETTAIPGGAMLLGGLLSFFALGGFLVGGLAAILSGVGAILAAERVLPEKRERSARQSPRALP